MTGDPRRTLLFLIREDQILLAMKKRGFGEGRWNGVGGKIEAGETVREAAIRECQEEIGVTPTHFYQVAENDFQAELENDPWNMYGYVYFCDEWDGEPVETEEMAPQWFNIADIPYKYMWQDDEFWLPHVLEGKKVAARFTFDEEDNLLTHDVDFVENLPLKAEA